MVKRTITITTILLILTIAVGLIVMLNKSSYAADDDIASGTSGTCSWVIDSEGVLTIRPTDGVSGTLARLLGLPSNNQNVIQRVIIEPGVKTSSNCDRIFYGLKNCTEMDISQLDTSDATNMRQMFYNCQSLTSIDVSSFNTEKVTDMSEMFYGCNQLTTLDLSNFNTENVTTMKRMFLDLKKVNSINLSSFNTNNVTDMSLMFYGCTKITTIDVSSFNTSNVTNMHDMFYACNNLASLDVTNFDTSNVTDMSGMFGGCSALNTIDLLGFNTSKVTNMSYMFQGCKFTSIDLTNFDTSKVTNMNQMFYGCKSLIALDLTSFDTSSVTDMGLLFHACWNLTSINLSSFNTENVTNMRYMFSECYELPSIDISNFNTDKVTNMNRMFYSCGKLTSLDLSNFNTSSVTDMGYMFYECKSLKDLNISSFDTSNVTDMTSMFNRCSDLNELDVSGFNTSKVTNMSQMFFFCKKISYLNVSSFDVSNVTNMGGIFGYCSALKNIDLSSWNPHLNVVQVRDEIDPETSSYGNTLYGMFTNCANLEILDLSSFDTSNVKSFSSMFEGCTRLETLNIGSWSMNSLVPHTNNSDYFLTSGIFKNCYRLKQITIGPEFDFGINIVSSYADKFPTPTGNGYTGKWIKIGNMGPFSSEEIRGALPNAAYAGTWIWQKTSKIVSYSYSGQIPEGASQLPENAEYEYGSIVTVPPDATAPGYTFSGWSRTGTFEMPAENVEITGTFTPRTDTPYKVEHYLEDLTEGEYTLAKTDNLTGTTDTLITAEARNYEGFTFDNTIDGTIESGTIKGDESLVLKLYYKRNSYNVTYSFTGDVPDNVSSLPQQETYKYGAEIVVPENATAEGYTFSGWIKDYITMPAQDIEITGYFIENPKSYSYKVEYFFDGEIDETLEETLNAEKDEEISLAPQTPLKHGNKNYTLVSNNHKVTISINDEDNVIEVYYESDVLDYEFEYPEGDGIPDKYQIQITYKVENGTWDDRTTETKIEIINLKDKNGNYSEHGTGELHVPEVGNNPKEGYIKGFWNEKIPSEVSNKDDLKEFVYSYEKVEKADIAELEGKIFNPKTDDIIHGYLLVGMVGVLALIIVRNIRKKYSRKAKKIQY